MFFFCSNTAGVIRALIKKQPAMLQKLLCLLMENIRNSKPQGQAKSSSTYSPTKVSKLENPKNTSHTCSMSAVMGVPRESRCFNKPFPAGAAFTGASSAAARPQESPLASTAPCDSRPSTSTTKPTQGTPVWLLHR